MKRIGILILLVLVSMSRETVAKEAITGNTIARDADKIVGTKYVYGGNSLKKGIDCSALVKKIYAKYGYKIPRRATWQAKDLPSCPTYTDIRDVRVGDTLYFKNKKGLIHHVSIVSGFNSDGTIIMTHAKGRKYGVVKEKIGEKYLKEFIGAKRFYQCTSVLGDFYTNGEIAEAIVYFSKENSLDPEFLYLAIGHNVDLSPLAIVLKEEEIEEVIKALSMALGRRGLNIRHIGQDEYLLLPNSIEMAKMIAYGLKESGVQFYAGLTLLDSKKVRSNEIENVFYPLPNLKLNKETITKCILQYQSIEEVGECIRKR